MKLYHLFPLLLLGIFSINCTKPETQSKETNVSKEPIKGLVTMGSTQDLRQGHFNVLKEADVHPDIYAGVVIKATWGALEPQRGVFDFSTIEQALNDIKNYNNLHPNHLLKAKLRISATINAPNWVLNLANGPVIVKVNQTISYPVGLFWTPEYRQAWQELQVALSQAYDTNNTIQEVCISAPAMATDEPFVTIFNAETIQNLQQKGFTDQAFRHALEGVIDDYSCWQHTLLDYSFNLYRKIDTGIPVNDIDFTLRVMRRFKERYGKRAVLSNHGLQENLSPGAIPIYDTFTELGGNIAAQTKGPNDLTDQSFTIGLNYGVSEFEIWDSQAAGGYADFNTADLQRWNNMINSH